MQSKKSIITLFLVIPKIFVLGLIFCSISFALQLDSPIKLSEFSKFDHITVEDGLSQSSVHCIFQDSKGFMWFGTSSGLNRFDGISFKNYKYNPANSKTISHNMIKVIYEDSRGLIWIGTSQGGLNCFDPEFEKFCRYNYDPKDKKTISSPSITSICEDRDGRLWIGTIKGLNLLNYESKQFTRFYHNPNSSHSLCSNRINVLYKDKKGLLWIGTDIGINKLIQDRDLEIPPEFLFYENLISENNLLKINFITSIFEAHSGNFWLGSHSGLLHFNRDNGTYICFKNQKNNPHSLSSNLISSIIEDQQNNLWIGTMWNGLNKLDNFKLNTEPVFKRYYNVPGNSMSINDNSIFSLFCDRSGVLWIGTNSGGLNKFIPKVNKFRQYSTGNNTAIWTIFEENSDVIWIGTNREGLLRYNRKTEQVKQFKSIIGNHNSISSNWITKIYKDRSGVLWIGTGNGLNKYNENKENFIRYVHKPNELNSLSFGEIYDIYEDSKHILWVGTDDGLNKFNRENNKFLLYQNDAYESGSLSNNSVRVIYEDQRNNMWFGTSDGLNKLITEDRTKSMLKFERFINDSKNPYSISDNTILSIYEDQSGILWIVLISVLFFWINYERIMFREEEFFKR